MSRAAEKGDLSGLLARCQKGDDRAWRELVDRFQSFVYSIPRRMGLSEEDCADIFQNTFVALHRSLNRIEAGAALPKWLAVTASRDALRLRRIKLQTPLAEIGDEERSLDDLVASEDQSAEEEAVAACDARLIRAAVGNLPSRCEKLLSALYLQEDMAYQEISESLGIPIGAIGPTRARCLEKLRKILEEDGFFA